MQYITNEVIQIIKDSIDVEIATNNASDPQIGETVFGKVAWIREQIRTVSLTNDLCVLCSGEGLLEVHKDNDDPEYQELWLDREKIEPTENGWHTVVCQSCAGRGYLEDNRRPNIIRRRSASAAVLRNPE